MSLFLDGTFRSKGFNDSLISLDIRAAKEINAVGYGSKDAGHNGFALGIL
jgi:hypothetical protein